MELQSLFIDLCKLEYKYDWTEHVGISLNITHCVAGEVKPLGCIYEIISQDFKDKRRLERIKRNISLHSLFLGNCFLLLSLYQHFLAFYIYYGSTHSFSFLEKVHLD